MKNILSSFYAKPLSIYLAFAVLILSSLTGPAEAMFLPQAGDQTAQVAVFDRAADIQKIRSVLESKQIAQRLMDYGLTYDEAMAKIDGMSDEQVHQLASNLDSIQAGGDVVGAVIGLLIIALLVVLLIYLLEGRIEVRRR